MGNTLRGVGGGKKGKGGRKSGYSEIRRAAVIQKAWDITHDALKDPSLPLLEKLRLTIPIVTKDITQHMHTTGNKEAITVVTYQLAFDKAGKPIRMPASVPDEKALVPK